MPNQGRPPSSDSDGSIWDDLARMEAEVVDPEEEATAHYDYNAVRERLKQLDPEALAAAEAMFDEDDDEPPTAAATPAPGPASRPGPPAPRPLTGRGLGASNPTAPNPTAPNPTAPSSPTPDARPPLGGPALPRPPAAAPYEASPLDEDAFDEELPTQIVADGQMDEIRALVDEKISQAGAAKMAALEHDDDDDDFADEVPTRLAPAEIADMARAATAELRGQHPTPRAAGPPPSLDRPQAAPLPEPMAKPPTAPLSPPASAAQPPGGQPARPLGYEDPDDDDDLMEMLAKQRRRDMAMYAIAAILFAVGILVLILNR